MLIGHLNVKRFSVVVFSNENMFTGVMSIATKVAIQLNCKIGGAPWAVPLPLAGLMVVGYDVCRDTAKKVSGQYVIL